MRVDAAIVFAEYLIIFPWIAKIGPLQARCLHKRPPPVRGKSSPISFPGQPLGVLFFNFGSTFAPFMPLFVFIKFSFSHTYHIILFCICIRGCNIYVMNLKFLGQAGLGRNHLPNEVQNLSIEYLFLWKIFQLHIFNNISIFFKSICYFIFICIFKTLMRFFSIMRAS